MLSVLLQQALASLQRGSIDKAASLFEAVLKLDPTNFDALHLLGYSRMEQGRNAEACVLIEQALKRQPGEPGALCNLGVALRATGKLNEAVLAYRKALTSNPNDATLHFNLGNALADLRQFDEAIKELRYAGELDPDDASARWNEGLVHLLCGDLVQGWEGYEHGWANGTRDKRFGSDAPLWNGSQALTGKTILAWAEQGYGDTIQFVRYTKLLSERGATVILQSQHALSELMTGVSGVSQVVVRGEALPAHDFQCPLMSLPRAFSTTLANIPAPAGVLVASERVAMLAKHLPDAARRIGLAWSGNMAHLNDRNRSLNLSTLLPLLKSAPSGTAFVCLQKELRKTDEPALKKLPTSFFRGEDLQDFSDTAALIENLDLVISVDTSVAHLAATMGKPVWLLLPFNPDWRWLLERDDSPWYPSVRLFRQARAGDWKEVLAKVALALADHKTEAGQAKPDNR